MLSLARSDFALLLDGIPVYFYFYQFDLLNRNEIEGEKGGKAYRARRRRRRGQRDGSRGDEHEDGGFHFFFFFFHFSLANCVRRTRKKEEIRENSYLFNIVLRSC